jgi:hypothetical protein
LSTESRVVILLAFAISVNGLLLAQDQGALPKNENVWASISVQPSVFWKNYTDRVQVHFVVLNDGPSAINPRIGSCRLLINGVEAQGWDYLNTVSTLGNAMRNPDFYNLPPGRPLQFVYALGEFFNKPGIYVVGWSCEKFKVTDVTIRVLPIDPDTELHFVAQERTTQAPKPSLWAAISIQPSILWRSETEGLMVWFSVVNDGPTPVDPEIGSAHLVINGVEIDHWVWDDVVGNGPAHPYEHEIPPGQPLEIIRGFGRYFTKPGVYTVGWWGENFRAQDITIRVLPVDQFSFDGRPAK